ncbi:beta-propeller domain-containing protein [Eubacterium oxidoreducens]|uniref:Secreted protein containing C-terminal beta-propeller domain n=1 Tax=Eubacterium oxidoreducens TaxID=1732 RepID=A0A1G6A5W2_EUBOX|nr:beta-propeller domain-containing protein [Eubacterium oxidoreducens]SDB03808.1 Secreted protein containing C-terminal beta-propeller domain [Eubacterium oxidoreducens]
MKDDKLLDELKKNLTEEPIPERIKPGRIEEMLNHTSRKKSFSPRVKRSIGGLVAACACFAIGLGAYHHSQLTPVTSTEAVTPSDDDTNSEVNPISSMFTVASGYEDIYNLLQESQENGNSAQIFESTTDSTEDVAKDSAEESSADSSYSETNVMTDGVDEGDIVKTDGNYIYKVEESKILIYDISGDQPELVSQITPKHMTSASNLKEMYVDDDKLCIISQNYEQNMILYDEYSTQSTSDIYAFSNDSMVYAETYDISDRKNPALVSTGSQSGNFSTSRKVDDILYLFTTVDMTLPSGNIDSVVTDDQLSSWIPSVNGSVISSDHFYLPDAGSRASVIGSVKFSDPSSTIDSTGIITNYSQVYVSTDAIYIYSSDYSGGDTFTTLAKFTYQEGKISACACGNLNGEINDSFAIHQQDEYLQVLTTTDTNNCIYVLDDNLEMVGSVTGIAPGEQIYSARFIGDLGYFVTYENTDPLWSVDFSDMENPTLIGSLDITGFSDYLHLWGDDKLLGIGYETDPDTGDMIGVKLTMFDISNPAKVKTLDSIVLKNAYYSPACEQYKCVLADYDKNLIGFAYEIQDKESYNSTYLYSVYSFKNKKFTKKLEKVMGSDDSIDIDSDNYRGLYADDKFYISTLQSLYTYELDGFELIDEQ